MKFFTKLTVFVQIMLFLVVVNVYSQNKIDNEGKDFYFAFMPNWHQMGQEVDSLYIFIFSKTATSGKVEYTDLVGRKNSVNFVIDQPNGSATLSFSPANYELYGQNNSGQILATGGADEEVSEATFHLTSEDEVTVIIHNEAVFTSDACLVLPTKSLGNNYYVLAYESNIRGIFSSDQNTPSQFVIVGTEDNTTIKIKPTTNTYRNGLFEQNITLDRGEAYLVQADIRVPNGPNNSDLTGTSVLSDKKIAVFGGQQRANVPYTDYASRDHLVEQMLPLETWGRETFIVPLYQSPATSNNYGDVAKVSAAYDDTEISIGGVSYGTLNAGERYTFRVTEPIYVSGDKPICAAYYKQSSQDGSTPNDVITIGDPFMLVLPPRSQFLREYNFMNVNLPTKYNSHWINIIIPTVATSSIRVDGNPIAETFTPIDGSEYSYANHRVSAGVHRIVADTNFGLCIYGYGRTNSYGYVGGLQLEPQDWTPPHYAFNSIDCYAAGFTFTEKNEQDTYIDSVVVLEQRNVNLKVIDSSKTEYSAELTLIDKYNDGVFKFFAKDSIGSITRDTIIIEGFTFTVSGGNSYKQVDYSDTVGYNSKNCIDVTLTNYGEVAKDISNLKLRGGTVISKSSTPKLLGAGESITFQVCFQSDYTSGWYYDTLDLDNDCFAETMATFAFYQKPDENKPGVEAEMSGCGDGLLRATEFYTEDYGFGTYKQISSDNLDITLQSLTEKEITLRLKLQDPYNDGTYEIVFEDRAGNDTTVKGVLQGFTASFVGNSTGEPISFSTQQIGNSKCMELLIENHGLLPITLDKISFAEKINFFIPQSQLPITIMPDSVVPFTICFSSNIPSEETLKDELTMTFNDCVSKKVIVEGKTESIVVGADTKCDYELVITLDKVSNSLSLEKIYPNPASGLLNLQLNVDKSRTMSIDLIGVGGEVYSVLQDDLQRGNYNLRISTERVPSGSYILQIISEGKRISKKVLINK